MAVQEWLDTQYPEIATRAKAEGAEIHWGDGTALVNTNVRGHSFAPRGKTPVTMLVGGTRQKLSMIATVTNQGKARWMIIDGTFNHACLIEILRISGLRIRTRKSSLFWTTWAFITASR